MVCFIGVKERNDFNIIHCFIVFFCFIFNTMFILGKSNLT